MADVENWIEAQKANGALGNASGSGNKAKPLLAYDRTNSKLPDGGHCQILTVCRLVEQYFAEGSMLSESDGLVQGVLSNVELYQTGISHNYRESYEHVASVAEKLDAQAKIRAGLGKLLGGQSSA